MLNLQSIVAVIVFLAATPSFAAEFPCAKGELITGTIKSDGQWELFQLKGSNQSYGLSSLHILSPAPPKGVVSLRISSQKPDRYGRLLVQAFVEGTWVQGKLLQQGKALNYPLGNRGDCLKALRKAEQDGETSKAGVWATNQLPIASENLDLLQQNIGRFAVIEGKILSVGNRSRRLYLNFGQKWSQDFTLSLSKKGKNAFKGDINRLIKGKGKTVQVRGILEDRQGPLIRLFDEAQILIRD